MAGLGKDDGIEHTPLGWARDLTEGDAPQRVWLGDDRTGFTMRDADGSSYVFNDGDMLKLPFKDGVADVESLEPVKDPSGLSVEADGREYIFRDGDLVDDAGHSFGDFIVRESVSLDQLKPGDAPSLVWNERHDAEVPLVRDDAGESYIFRDGDMLKLPFKDGEPAVEELEPLKDTSGYVFRDPDGTPLVLGDGNALTDEAGKVYEPDRSLAGDAGPAFIGPVEVAGDQKAGVVFEVETTAKAESGAGDEPPFVATPLDQDGDPEDVFADGAPELRARDADEQRAPFFSGGEDAAIIGPPPAEAQTLEDGAPQLRARESDDAEPVFRDGQSELMAREGDDVAPVFRDGQSELMAREGDDVEPVFRDGQSELMAREGDDVEPVFKDGAPELRAREGDDVEPVSWDGAPVVQAPDPDDGSATSHDLLAFGDGEVEAPEGNQFSFGVEREMVESAPEDFSSEQPVGVDPLAEIPGQPTDVYGEEPAALDGLAPDSMEEVEDLPPDEPGV